MKDYPLWLCWWLFTCSLIVMLSLIALSLQCWSVVIDLLLLTLYRL